MSDQLQARVEELLAETDDASKAALSPTDDSAAGSSLDEAAQEASDLVESTDPQELLAAIGLDTLPDGTQPETIPEAIARGGPEQVDDLRRLMTLARLADRDESELEAAAERLDEAIDAERIEDESIAVDETPEPDSAEREATADTGDEESGGLEAQLRSSLSDRVEQFGDDVSGLQEQLESVAASATDDETDAQEGEDTVDDADDTTDDADDTEAEDGDELFGIGQDSDQKGSIGSSDSSRHSTMAPPPSDRADMRAVRRHSTMPGKD